ncbi:hypothetical protein RA269_28155 [Pseudomonas syringae pv. tagetis]|uniref:hypothetical protein n=1 Tax=Pseudomonas syringae group genomosp. 7 TaxID=251699 RepID=UPI00376FE716
MGSFGGAGGGCVRFGVGGVGVCCWCGCWVGGFWLALGVWWGSLVVCCFGGCGWWCGCLVWGLVGCCGCCFFFFFVLRG